MPVPLQYMWNYQNSPGSIGNAVKCWPGSQKGKRFLDWVPANKDG